VHHGIDLGLFARMLAALMVTAADITAGDVAAIIIAVLLAIAVVGLLLVLRSLAATLASLRLTVDDLRRNTVPLVNELHDTVKAANSELERVDGLLVTAESISATVDSASRLAYLAFSNPVIKAAAVAAGTGRVVRRMRKDR
jgi:hypothetical protein